MSREKKNCIYKNEYDSYMCMKKHYTFDENYFDSIDTEDKAYILGLLFADGYNNERRGTITLSLQERDREILDKISWSMNSTKPLQFIDMKKYHTGKSHQNQYRLNLCSRHTSQVLNKLGCFQAKSYSCRFPNFISSTLLRHFIRGYFDGDGCISYTYNNKQRPCGSVSFVGSASFCKSLSGYLRLLKINAKVSYNCHSDKRIRRVAFGGRNQLAKFHKYIYDDASVYLSRKKTKFDDFIAISKEYLTKNKPTNIYRNTKGCRQPFRVVKTLNYKSIHLGSFETRDGALKASTEWDKTHSSISVD